MSPDKNIFILLSILIGSVEVPVGAWGFGRGRVCVTWANDLWFSRSPEAWLVSAVMLRMGVRSSLGR